MALLNLLTDSVEECETGSLFGVALPGIHGPQLCCHSRWG